MKEEKIKRGLQPTDTGPDEESPGDGVWSRSQWRRFMIVFTILTIVTFGTFWFFLMRHELLSRRLYTDSFLQYDQEWSYLQRLARLNRIRQISTQEGVQEAVFDGKLLDLSFSYPKPWGDFEESKPLSYYMSASLKRGTQERLIGAYSQIPPPGHSSGWDTVAVGIRSPDDITHACERNTFADTCLTLTTRSGIRYARIRYAHFLEPDGIVEDVVIYVFVNPESDFLSMSLSNVGLRKSSIPHRISDMDAIMNSMVFQRL